MRLAKDGYHLLCLMPRKSRKSFILNVLHSTWLILNDPNIRILMVSNKDKNSKEFLGVIKNLFKDNAGIKKYFPEFHVPPSKQLGNESKFTHPLRTMTQLKDPTMAATYLGSPVASGRCDVLICDDPIEKKHVTTVEQADKALVNFNDLIPLVDDTPGYGRVFVIGTRWGFNDIYGAILGEARGDDAEVQIKRKTKYETIIRHCLESETGEPDFEHGKPIFSLRNTKQSLHDLLDEYRIDPKRGEEDFWKQMMNVVQSPGAQKFLEEWFDNWAPRLPGNIVWSGIVLDSATKDEQILMRGDYTAAHVGHFDAYGHLYLTDALHSDSLRSPDLMKNLIALSQRHGTFNIVKEKVGEEMFFGMCAESYMNQNLPFTPYALAVRGMGKKVVRMVEALQGPFMAQKIHFVEGYPKKIWRKLKDELIHVGQWANDDLGDALSLFFHKGIRIQPTSFQPRDQLIPRHARIVQRSTAKNNPAAMRHFNGRRDEVQPPPNWKTRWPSKEDGSLRSDPFTGDAQGVDVGDLRDWVSGRNKN